MTKQTELGKAFEYACAIAMSSMLEEQNESVLLKQSAPLDTAKRFYGTMPEDRKEKLLLAGRAAAKVLLRLEPCLKHTRPNDKLVITLQTDEQGQVGDVRDLLCIRTACGWEIGLSCKHNHRAVKHSRLSATIDFGREWLGIPCSNRYFERVTPIFERLREIRDSARRHNIKALWRDMGDKETAVYRPVLEAFRDELLSLAQDHSEAAGQLIQYLLGRYDFYKVIADDAARSTTVEGININGTLNRTCGGERPQTAVAKLRMPRRLIEVKFKEDENGNVSGNTLEVTCDSGWQVSMRIHNASSEVEPSLKFDVQLISFPASAYRHTQAWEI